MKLSSHRNPEELCKPLVPSAEARFCQFYLTLIDVTYGVQVATGPARKKYDATTASSAKFDLSSISKCLSTLALTIDVQLEAAESRLCSGAPLAALERCKAAEDAAQKVRTLRKNHVGRIKELESKVNAVQPSIDCLQEQIGSLERQLQKHLFMQSTEGRSF